jgi:hypothetical protein
MAFARKDKEVEALSRLHQRMSHTECASMMNVLVYKGHVRHDDDIIPSIKL